MQLHLPCWNHFSHFHALSSFQLFHSQSMQRRRTPHKPSKPNHALLSDEDPTFITLNLTPLMLGRVYVQRRWSDCVSDERRAFLIHTAITRWQLGAFLSIYSHFHLFYSNLLVGYAVEGVYYSKNLTERPSSPGRHVGSRLQKPVDETNLNDDLLHRLTHT